MKQKIIPILVILAGFFLLSYPFVSNYLFEKSAGSTVESYQEKAAGMDQAIIKKVMDEAKQYNGELLRSSIQLTDPFKEKRLDGETVHYNRILNIDGSSIMGYLKIPCISINMPIYHGTSGTVLEHGIGHLAASSFPIGGKDTHAVLTGHTGLSSAKIFADLTEMKKEISFYTCIDKKAKSFTVWIRSQSWNHKGQKSVVTAWAPLSLLLLSPTSGISRGFPAAYKGTSDHGRKRSCNIGYLHTLWSQ